MALGNFAVLNEITRSVTSIFRNDISLDELTKENAQLMLEVNRMRKMRSENDELRAMISFRDTSKYPLIPAKVVSKLVTKIKGILLSIEDLVMRSKKECRVLSEKGLVGLIMDVAENYSVVRTLFNSNLNIAITLQRTNVNGILNYNGRNLIVKDIPTTYDVQVGDSIETSDFSSLFPSINSYWNSEKERIKCSWFTAHYYHYSFCRYFRSKQFVHS